MNTKEWGVFRKALRFGKRIFRRVGRFAGNFIGGGMQPGGGMYPGGGAPLYPPSLPYY